MQPKIKPNSESFEELLDHAENLILNGDLSAALDYFCTGLKQTPANTQLVRRIGDVLRLQGNIEAADLCARGVLPDEINYRYFFKESIDNLTVSPGDTASAHCFTFHPEEKITLHPPLRNKTERHLPQFNYKTTDAKTSFVSVMENGGIWFDGLNTIALDANQQLIRKLGKGNQELAYSCATDSAPLILTGSACFLDARSSSIYYHWMLDVLPKFKLLEALPDHLKNIDHYIVKAPKGFQKNTLAILGIDVDKILTTEANPHIVADTMIVPYLKNDLGDVLYSGLGLGMGSWVPEYVKQCFLKPRDQISKKNKHRIYLSRSATGTRKIEHEDLLIEHLGKRGFSIIEAEKLSIEEQAHLFSNADVILGAHGAGMTNLCFAAKGTVLLEIFGNYVVPCYWVLSQHANINYHQFISQDVKANNHSNPTRVENIELEIDVFLAYLDSVLENSGLPVFKEQPNCVSAGEHSDQVSTASPKAQDKQAELIATLVSEPNNRSHFITLATYFENTDRVDYSNQLYKGHFPLELANTYDLNIFKEKPSKNLSQCEQIFWSPAEQVPLKPPMNVDENRNNIFEQHHTDCTPEYVDLFQNATLAFDGMNKLILDAEGTRSRQHSSVNAFLLHNNLQEKIASRVSLRGFSVMLAERNYDNFYHWIFDLLPVLGMIEASGIPINKIDNILTPKLNSHFHRESLEILGVRPDQLVDISEHNGAPIRCEALAMVHMKNKMGMAQSKMHIQWLRTKLGQCSPLKTFSNDKLVIKREKRGFDNPTEVIDFFEKRGYTAVAPEHFSFAEQISLFANAKKIASPHGAALSLLAFARPLTEVHEFYGRHVHPCFWAISNSLDHLYNNYNCSEVRNKDITMNNKGLGDRLKEELCLTVEDLNGMNI